MSLDAQAVVAAADLIGRAGATEFAWDCPHTPDEGPDHNCPHVTWTCSAKYRGHRIFTDPQPYPGQAANALAVKILEGGLCRCGWPASITKQPDACHWKLVGQRWEPGCDAPPIDGRAEGLERGDLVGLNRAARRRMKRRKGKR